MTAALARRDSQPTSGSRRSTAAGRTSERARAASSPTRVVRPQLRVLDQEALRRRARRRNMAMTMFIVLIIGFFAAALAQAQLVANQHELDVLRTRIATAEAERARLERAVEESSAPGSIIKGAEELGMVRANDPIYLAAVAPAPEVIPISTLGAVSANTAGLEAAVSGSDSIDGSAMATGTTGSTDVAAEAESGDSIAAPLIASIAGTRAVASGIGGG